MNDTSPAGVPAQLKVHVAHKDFNSAQGGSRRVIADLAFALRLGELAALVGPSGCGKTTLLRIIAGLDGDYAGVVERPPQSRLGVMFQEPRLLPWRSVEQNIRLAAPEAAPDVLSNLFETVGLATHRQNFPGELSLGLARRAALVRAFAVDPDLLLLDEPFVSLDAALATQMRRALVELVTRRPVTTLLVTHDLDEAIELADRVLLLSAAPCRVVGEVPIERPRTARTPQELAAIRAAIERRRDQAG